MGLNRFSAIRLMSGARYGILSTVHLDCKAKDCAGQLMEVMRLFSVNHLEVKTEDVDPKEKGCVREKKRRICLFEFFDTVMFQMQMQGRHRKLQSSCLLATTCCSSLTSSPALLMSP